MLIKSVFRPKKHSPAACKKTWCYEHFLRVNTHFNRGLTKFQPNSSNQPITKSKDSPTGWIAVIALIIIVAGVVIWQTSSLMTPSQSSNQKPSSSQLNLVSGISATYEQGKNSYVFSYRLTATDTSELFYVSENAAQSRSFPAVAGAVYRDLGLEMKVVSVTSELLVLQVQPLTD